MRSAPCRRKGTLRHARQCPRRRAQALGTVELPHPHASHIPLMARTMFYVRISSTKIRVVAPEDVSAVEDMYQALGEAYVRDATWAEPWPAAVAAAGALDARLTAFPAAAPRVCELGCGLGIPSLAAAAALATRGDGGSVLACDWEPRALWCVAQSAANAGHQVAGVPREVNSCALPAVRKTHSEHDDEVVRCIESPEPPTLRTCPSAGELKQPPRAVQLTTEALDWFDDAAVNDAQVKHVFDVVVATDVLYQSTFADAVARCTLARLRCGTDAHATGAGVLLADATRRRGKEGIRDTFHDRLLAHDRKASEDARARGMPYRNLTLSAQWEAVVEMDAPEADSNEGSRHAVTLRWYERGDQ